LDSSHSSSNDRKKAPNCRRDTAHDLKATYGEIDWPAVVDHPLNGRALKEIVATPVGARSRRNGGLGANIDFWPLADNVMSTSRSGHSAFDKGMTAD
jgi:hypothetical protein